MKFSSCIVNGSAGGGLALAARRGCGTLELRAEASRACGVSVGGPAVCDAVVLVTGSRADSDDDAAALHCCP